MAGNHTNWLQKCNGNATTAGVCCTSTLGNHTSDHSIIKYVEYVANLWHTTNKPVAKVGKPVANTAIIRYVAHAWQTCGKPLDNLWQRIDKPLTNYWHTSDKTLTNLWQKLGNLWQTITKPLTHNWGPLARHWFTTSPPPLPWHWLATGVPFTLMCTLDTQWEWFPHDSQHPTMIAHYVPMVPQYSSIFPYGTPWSPMVLQWLPNGKPVPLMAPKSNTIGSTPRIPSGYIKKHAPKHAFMVACIPLVEPLTCPRPTAYQSLTRYSINHTHTIVKSWTFHW